MVLIAFLILFILYPLVILLVDSFYGGNGFTISTFQRIMAMPTFVTAIGNTLKVGFLVDILSTIVGLITRFLLKIYDNSVYGFWGIVIVQRRLQKGGRYNMTGRLSRSQLLHEILRSFLSYFWAHCAKIPPVSKYGGCDPRKRKRRF